MKYRFLLSIMAAALIAPALSASPIGEQRALEIARQHATQNQLMKTSAAAAQLPMSVGYAARSESGDAALLYAVNRGDGQGYVIVAGDDVVTGPVLGYCDSGTFDYEQAPENLKWWLAEYGRMIEYAAENGLTVSQAPAFSSNAGPLITTQWNQSEPYNDLCPIDPSTGERSVTGCVATAMAQVMNYWEWPKQGIGSHSYTRNDMTLEVDFSQTTYEWGNMADTYDGTNTDAQNIAVATLMYHCGVAADMGYSSGGSGAGMVNALRGLIENFGYGKDAYYAKRDAYAYSEWLGLIKGEIDAGRPLIYDGASTGGGHAFVIDGYNTDGLFHVNWGWGGMADGYYVLATLDPTSQGIGGSSSGYAYDQGAVINLDPAQGGEQASIRFTAQRLYLKADEDSQEVAELTITRGESFKLGVIELWNNNITAVPYFCVLFEDVASGEITEGLLWYYGNGWQPGAGYRDVSAYPDGIASLSDGEYKAYFAILDEEGNVYPVDRVGSGPAYATVVVAGDQITISLVDEAEPVTLPDVTCSQILPITNVQFANDRNTRVIATLTNNSTDNYNSSICFVLCEQGTKNIVYPAAGTTYPMITVALEPGDKTRLEMVQTISDFDPGTQTLFDIYLWDNVYQDFIPGFYDTIDITDSDIVMSEFSMKVSIHNDNPSDLTVWAEVSADDRGTYYGTISAFLYEGKDGVFTRVAALGSRLIAITPEIYSFIAIYNGRYDNCDSNSSYRIYFYDNSNSEWLGSIEYKLPTVSYLKLTSAQYTSTAPEAIGLTATFATDGSYAPFSGTVTAWLMQVHENGYSEQVASLGTQQVEIAAGGITQAMTFSGSYADYDPTGSYVVAFVDDVHKSNNQIGTVEYVYNLSSNITAVEAGMTSVYPNPVKDVLNVEAASAIEAVAVYTLAGAQVHHGREAQIDMSALPGGTYIVRVTTTTGTTAHKVVKR